MSEIENIAPNQETLDSNISKSKKKSKGKKKSHKRSQKGQAQVQSQSQPETQQESEKQTILGSQEGAQHHYQKKTHHYQPKQKHPQEIQSESKAEESKQCSELESNEGLKELQGSHQEMQLDLPIEGNKETIQESEHSKEKSNNQKIESLHANEAQIQLYPHKELQLYPIQLKHFLEPQDYQGYPVHLEQQNEKYTSDSPQKPGDGLQESVQPKTLEEMETEVKLHPHQDVQDKNIGLCVQKAEEIVEDIKEKFNEAKDEGKNRSSEIFEVVGENYSNYKQKLLDTVHDASVVIKSSINEYASSIKHILSGPNALEVVANQQAFIDALSNQNYFVINIPEQVEHYEIRFVPKGSKLCWEFIVESMDIEFSLKQRVAEGENNEPVNYTILERHIYNAGEKVQGKWETDEDSTALLLWNNSDSTFTPKNIACRIAVMN